MDKPYINSCKITPNPVNAKATISIVLDIEDKPIVFQKSTYYTTEIKSGEKIGVL